MIDKGCIAEKGTHDELISKDGVYKRLVLRQLTAGAPLLHGDPSLTEQNSINYDTQINDKLWLYINALAQDNNWRNIIPLYSLWLWVIEYLQIVIYLLCCETFWVQLCCDNLRDKSSRMWFVNWFYIIVQIIHTDVYSLSGFFTLLFVAISAFRVLWIQCFYYHTSIIYNCNIENWSNSWT